jgi:hypothetical protein
MLSKKHACAKSKTMTSFFVVFPLEAAACRIVSPRWRSFHRGIALG